MQRDSTGMSTLYFQQEFVVHGCEDRLVNTGLYQLESVTAKLAVKYKDLSTHRVKDLLFHPQSAEKPGT